MPIICELHTYIFLCWTILQWSLFCIHICYYVMQWQDYSWYIEHVSTSYFSTRDLPRSPVLIPYGERNREGKFRAFVSYYFRFLFRPYLRSITLLVLVISKCWSIQENNWNFHTKRFLLLPRFKPWTSRSDWRIVALTISPLDQPDPGKFVNINPGSKNLVPQLVTLFV